MKKVLLVIDPQNDFVNSKGSLYVPGSEERIANLAKYIRDCSENGSLDRLVLSQDTHTEVNVGFSKFWENNPELFTKITAEDLRTGKYVPRENYKIVVEELASHLEAQNQVITIWPLHCIENTWGCDFADEIKCAIGRWIYLRDKKGLPDNFNLLIKGLGYHEAYSIVDCCKSGHGDKTSFLELIDVLTKGGVEELEVCGFCTDICVKYSVHGLLAELIMRFNFGDSVPKKITFLPDCSKALGDDEIANAEIQAMLDSYNKLVG